jgi:hypothetical protein
LDKILTISDRLTQFIDFLGISERKFSQNVGFSNGLLGAIKKGGSFGMDKLEKILYTYPQLNVNWLLLGTGEMINSDLRPVLRPDLRPEVDPEGISVLNEPVSVYGKAKDDIVALKQRIRDLEMQNLAYLKAFEAMGRAGTAVESSKRNVA